MFDSIFTRNFSYSIKHPVRTWAVRKACRDHVKSNPMCEWCGGIKKVEAHHIVPLWYDESAGADPDNFISLCRPKRCHILIGHNGSFATKFVENVRTICSIRQVKVRGDN